MSIILIRHPETEWNVQGLFQGVKEGPVTSASAASAQALVSQMDYAHLHHIYHGPNRRTAYLAELLKQRYPRTTVTMEPRLQERSFGDYEGQVMEEVGRNEGFSPDDLLSRYLWSPPNGESYQEVSDRVNNFVFELRQLHLPDEVVICVTSGAVIRNIMHVQQGLSLAQVFELKIAPLQMLEVPHL